MSNDTTPQDVLEQHFIKKILEINNRILELEAERKALERLVMGVQRERQVLNGVTRRNSANRILVEKAILNALYDGPKDNGALYKKACQIDIDLKAVTFRSYLHRLKQREAIKNSNKIGFWELVQK